MQDSAMFNAHQRRITDWALQHRLPTISRSSGSAEAGGLLQYGEEPPEMARRAAGQLARILRGAKPAELPVEQPTLFRLIVNRKTAKTLGLQIPPALLARADDVID